MRYHYEVFPWSKFCNCFFSCVKKSCPLGIKWLMFPDLPVSDDEFPKWRFEAVPLEPQAPLLRFDTESP